MDSQTSELFKQYLKETEHDAFLNKRIAESCLLKDIYLSTVSQNPKTIVEVGVREGLSTRAFCRAGLITGAKVISCDITNPGNVCTFSNWTFHQSTGVEFGTFYSGDSIDVLCIDTSELYPEVKDEIAVWFDKLALSCTVFFFCTNLNNKLIWEDGTWTWGGWDNKRGVIRAVQEYFGITFDESKVGSYINGDWTLAHKPWGGGWTTCQRN